MSKYLSSIKISSTGTSSFSDGTISSPSLTFTNDTNTGIYRIGSDNLGITLGGTKQIDINTTGTTFSNPLRNVAGSVSNPSYSFSNDINTGIYSNTADTISLTTGGYQKMQILTNKIKSYKPLYLPISSLSTVSNRDP